MRCLIPAGGVMASCDVVTFMYVRSRSIRVCLRAYYYFLELKKLVYFAIFKNPKFQALWISNVPLEMCRLWPSSPKGAYNQWMKTDSTLHYIFTFIIVQEETLPGRKAGVVSRGCYFEM